MSDRSFWNSAKNTPLRDLMVDQLLAANRRPQTGHINGRPIVGMQQIGHAWFYVTLRQTMIPAVSRAALTASEAG